MKNLWFSSREPHSVSNAAVCYCLVHEMASLTLVAPSHPAPRATRTASGLQFLQRAFCKSRKQKTPRGGGAHFHFSLAFWGGFSWCFSFRTCPLFPVLVIFWLKPGAEDPRCSTGIGIRHQVRQYTRPLAYHARYYASASNRALHIHIGTLPVAVPQGDRDLRCRYCAVPTGYKVLAPGTW